MGIKLKNNNNNLDLTTKIQQIVIEGGVYTPSVDKEGNLSWIPSREGLAPVETVNIKGVPGDKGEKGDRGEQGIQGIQGIPGKQGEQGIQGIRGEKGERGEPGKDGAQGIQGVKGDTGAQGEKGESGVYVGTTEPTDADMLVWINPEGEASAGLATTDYVDSKIPDVSKFQTEEQVNALINSALEEVENGTY